MHEVARGLIILRPKQLFVDWINSWSTDTAKISLDDACKDTDAILIPEFESEGEAIVYVHLHFTELFKHLLGEWCSDPSLWPVRRDYETFREWCEVILHSMVLDMVNAEEGQHGLN